MVSIEKNRDRVLNLWEERVVDTPDFVKAPLPEPTFDTILVSALHKLAAATEAPLPATPKRIPRVAQLQEPRDPPRIEIVTDPEVGELDRLREDRSGADARFKVEYDTNAPNVIVVGVAER